VLKLRKALYGLYQVSQVWNVKLVDTLLSLGFLEEPREDHLVVVKRIFHYVAGTSNWGLLFGRKKGNQTLLIGFHNADFARDVDARKSTTEVIFSLATSHLAVDEAKSGDPIQM
jgi:hypothetical protein